ncbi:ferritin family protein [Candidatus Bipolaricaulota bacterium]|nr:ferritin family protein [Candidatus Bipolaricaulota bacterium]
MSILEQAIALEERAETYYRSSKQGIEDQGALSVLDLLASEEHAHAEALRAVEPITQARAISAQDTGLDLLNEVKRLVSAKVEGGLDTVFSDTSMQGILQAAMEIEQTTEAFYRDHAESAADEDTRRLFADLAEREQKHYLIVSSLAEYFDRPQAWVESAEFGLRLDDY